MCRKSLVNIHVWKPSSPFSTTQAFCISLFSVSSTLFCFRAILVFIYLYLYLTSCFHLTFFHVIFFSLHLAVHSFFWKNILYPVSKQVSFMSMATERAGTGSISSWNLCIPSRCFLKTWRGILLDQKAGKHIQFPCIWVILTTLTYYSGNVFGR